jgi:hypothetical protein
MGFARYVTVCVQLYCVVTVLQSNSDKTIKLHANGNITCKTSIAESE